MSIPNIEWGSDGVTINGETNSITGTLTVSGDLTAQSDIIVGSTTLNPTIGITVGTSPNTTIIKNAGDITTTGIMIGNGTSFSNNGTGTIGSNLNVTGNINIGSGPQIQLNSDGTAEFGGNVTIGSSAITLRTDGSANFKGQLDARTLAISDGVNSPNVWIYGSDGNSSFSGKGTFSGGIEIGNSNQASITNLGEGTFASVSAPSITASTSLMLKNTTVNSITTSTSSLPDSPDTSIPTIGYLTKAIGKSTFIEPFQIIDTSSKEPANPTNPTNPTYSYEIRMWIKDADAPDTDSKYFGKKYSYTYDSGQSKYVFSESAVTGTGDYPW